MDLNSLSGEFVWVYRYKYWDPDAEAMVIAPRLATVESIKAGLGSIISQSGIRVPRRDLDPHGFYAPKEPLQPIS